MKKKSLLKRAVTAVMAATLLIGTFVGQTEIQAKPSWPDWWNPGGNKQETEDVVLYVLKDEISNIEYGYDVSNELIQGRPSTDFVKFGTAKIDKEYADSLIKQGSSTKRGEVLNETLFDYNLKNDTYTASGEKTDAGKFLEIEVADTQDARKLVEKINDNYNIIWYVIKEESDGWHMDGYICKDTTTEEQKVKVTVNHKIYDPSKDEYVLINNSNASLTEEILANSIYESKSLYPKREKTGNTITIDGAFTDWETLPEYWVSSEFNKDVTVDTGKNNTGKKSLETHSLVKLHNDNVSQKIYAYMQVSDVYETYFRTDEFKVSVNKGKKAFEFKVGDADGNIINGDISKMQPGVHRLYLFDTEGNRVVGGEATMYVNSNHLNTSIEIGIPYDVVSDDITESKVYVTGFEKESGGMIESLSSTSYDADNYLNAKTQLAYEDVVLCYTYASEQVVESIKFATINIEGTSTAPYILAVICGVIALAGFSGNKIKKRKMNIC